VSFADHSDFVVEPDDERTDPCQLASDSCQSAPPIRTLGQDLADVARYRALRLEVAVIEGELRIPAQDDRVTTLKVYWADRLRDLLDRFPEGR
jgi:hypothetical protein